MNNYCYRETSDFRMTAVDWIPSVPRNWELTRNKYLFFKEKVIVGNLAAKYKVLSLTMKGVIARDVDSNMGKMPKEWGQYQLVKENELLMCLFDIDVTPRTVGHVDEIGIVSPAYSRYIKISKELEMKYFYYWYLNLDMRKSLLHLSKNLRSSISSTEFNKLEVCNPPIVEQKKIANFLDIKAAQFDQIISKKEKLIVKLEEAKKSLISEVVTGKVKIVDGQLVERDASEMKDSGVEWIGDMPRVWNLVRIKMLSNISRGASPRPIDDPKFFDDENGEYGWTRIADVTKSDKFLVETKEKMSALGANLSVKLEPGSLFLSIAGSVGKPCITAIKACVHDGFVYFPTLDKRLNDFLYIVFSGGQCYKGLGKLGTQLNLNRDTVGNIFLPMDKTLATQIEIGSFLDKKISEFDLIVENETKILNKLKQAKQSLISEAVTGKIDLRDWEIIEEGELQ